jgi:hypothetical protein
MQRRIALVMGALAVLAAAARPVAAAPAAPGSTAAPLRSAVPANAVGLALADVSTAGLAATLDAGGAEEHDLVVSNHTSDLRLTIRLTATDATGKLGEGAASWLSFGDDAVQLDPRAATTVPMTIAVPNNTPPGAVLAHVNAAIETAVAAVDGSPREGTARRSLPVSITVRGTPTAQIAIADVHRVDDGPRHQLAVVLRNYGVEGTQVKGTVRVLGGRPQTLKFDATLVPSRDTTLTLPWDPPAKDQPAELAIEVAYGRGDVATWSSTLGGPPVTLTPTTLTDTATVDETAGSGPGDATVTLTAAKPWWKKGAAPILLVLAVALAAAWFVVEMRRSGRRAPEMVLPHPYLMAPPGWAPGPNDATVELAKQLVALTEVIVRLATGTGSGSGTGSGTGGGTGGAPAPPARARSPGDLAPADLAPAEPAQAPAPDPTAVVASGTGPPPSAPPEPVSPGGAEVAATGAARADPASGSGAAEEVMRRLVELDRNRRRLRKWMDEEPAQLAYTWLPAEELARRLAEAQHPPAPAPPD